MRTQYSTTSSTNALTRSGNLPGSSLCRIKASVASLSRAGSRSACSAVGRSSACRMHVASMRTCAVGSPAESLSSASICSVCAEKDSIVDGNSTLSMTTCGSSGSSASLEVLPILRSSSITVSSSGPSSDIACRPQRRGSERAPRSLKESSALDWIAFVCPRWGQKFHLFSPHQSTP